MQVLKNRYTILVNKEPIKFTKLNPNEKINENSGIVIHCEPGNFQPKSNYNSITLSNLQKIIFL